MAGSRCNKNPKKAVAYKGGRRTKTPQRARSKKACRGTARKGCASRTRKGTLDYTTKKGSKFYNRGSRRQRRAQGTKRKSRPYAKLIKALGL